MTSKPGILPQRVDATVLSRDRDGAVFDVAGQSVRVDAMAARVFALCDGLSSPAEIRERMAREQGAPFEGERVWRALDALADAGLLVARVTPPASPPTSARRAFFTRTLPGAAAGLGVTPAFARTAEQSQKLQTESESKAQVKAQEQDSKKAQEQSLKVAQESVSKQAAESQAKQQLQQESSTKEGQLKISQESDSKEQAAKGTSSEQTQKAQELDAKVAQGEQQNKLRELTDLFAETDAKRSAEQFNKADFSSESLAKVAQEESAKTIELASLNISDAPEPASLALFGGALAALALARYRGRAAEEGDAPPSADKGA